MHFKGLASVFREPHRRLTGAHSDRSPESSRDGGNCGDVENLSRARSRATEKIRHIASKACYFKGN